MITREGERVAVSGPLLTENLPEHLTAVASEINGGARTIDLARVTDVDSSALAMLLELQRQGRQRHHDIRVVNLPANLVTLARLYGVAPLLENRD